MNAFLLWHREPAQALGLASDRRVLRAHEVPPLLQAADVLTELEALRATEQARLEAATAQARTEGRQQGFAQGQADARDQLGRALAALAQQQESARAQVQQALPQLALEVARKLIGALPTEAVLAGLAVQAARELLPARTWRLHVHPAQAATLQAALQAADPEDKAGLARAEIVPDAHLGETDCRLITEFGSADASLATQVQRLAQAWGLAA
ncbi:MAG: hypothetical protein EKK53_23125 [Burkholderiales bacterium]|nr:MAG: hypothetical protein EKK53_23125 [Burkholderiales bacterium]